MPAYLDNSSTTMQRREVTEAMLDAFENVWGNPSSLHRMGIDAEKKVKASRRAIAEGLGVSEEELYFTSGGTESDNTAIFGACRAMKRAGKHIITTSIEHPAVLECFQRLEESGFEVTRIDPQEDGVIDAGELKASVREDTILVSVMHVNNETGALQPVEEIGRFLKERKERGQHVFFHCDAVQSFGKIHIPVREAGIDALSASGHKIHGPKGTGLLYVDHNRRVVPFMCGGGQERGMRSGTENVPGIVGLAAASELAFSEMERNLKKVASLRERLLAGIISEIPDVEINGPLDEERHLPYILNVSFLGTRAEVLLHMLEQDGIFVSTGSACSSNSKKRGSHVLRAMGVSEEAVEGAVRFSFSCQNTEAEIDETLLKLKGAVAQNRRMLSIAGKSGAKGRKSGARR